MSQKGTPGQWYATEPNQKRALGGEGVCLTCDAEFAEPEQYTGGGDVWPLGIVAAAADAGTR